MADLNHPGLDEAPSRKCSPQLLLVRRVGTVQVPPEDRDVVQSTCLQPLNHIAVDLRSPGPSYQQVARQLRERITSGEIGPREPLPSITRIVQETGLAVGTVRRAIDVLVKEGYAYTVPGRGTYAATKPEVDG
jgi:hypothetical protein